MRVMVFEDDGKIAAALEFLLCGTGIVIERAAWVSMCAAAIADIKYDWLIICFEWSPAVGETLAQLASGLVDEVVMVSNDPAGGSIERMCLEGVSRVYQLPAEWNRIAADIQSAAGALSRKSTGLGFPL